MVRKNPGFSLVAVGTLALAIGANTAIFSVADTVILRPLSYPDASRLFVVQEVVPQFSHFAPVLPANAMHFRQWRSEGRSFEELSLIGILAFNLTGTGEPQKIVTARVSPSLFPMLGMETQLGRTFLPEEDRPGRDQVVVLNDELWRRRFGGDPGVIGRKITLDGKPYEVVGVLRPRQHFPKIGQLYSVTVADLQPEMWKPFALRDDELEEMGDFNFVCIGRLKRGVTAPQALAELNVIQANFVKQAPFRVDLSAVLTPLQEQITGRARAGLGLLLAAVGAVLLIGCVNIANLVLARAVGRQHELAVRSAIGASRGRLMRQMLTESLFLSSTGGALGLGIAYGGLRAIVAFAPANLPRIDEVRLDGRVLMFTALLSMLAGLLFGLLPAWRYAKADPLEAMKGGGRGATANRGSGRLRSLLVAAETGLCAMCLIAAGLLLHSFVNVLKVDKGFETSRVVTVGLNLSGDRYPDVEKKRFFLRSLIEKIRPLHGVESVGISNVLPLGGEGSNNTLRAEGSEVPIMERPIADIRLVNAEYFRAMGISLRSGRIFDEADRERRVALVSASTARRLWPEENAIGKRFQIGGDDSPIRLAEVTGIVGDVHDISLTKGPSLTVYLPYWQAVSLGPASLAVRTAAEPGSAVAAIRAAIRQADPDLPVPEFQTMENIVGESVAPRLFQMRLVLLFGVAGLLLASLGTYGALSYSVAQRAGEMGIRIALGAAPGNIVRLVLWQGLWPAAAGLAGGVLASLAMGRVLGSLLFGVTGTDPVTIAGVIAVLGAVAVAATYIPAVRATRVDPLQSLRVE